MHLKKKVAVFVGIILALLIAVAGFAIYTSFHPKVMILRGIPSSSMQSQKEFYLEQIRTAVGHSGVIPIAQSVEDKLKELSIWNNAVNEDIYQNYMAPLKITVSGEVKDGKTTLRYEGYATTLDGQSVEYLQEKTFDFAFVSQEELLP